MIKRIVGENGKLIVEHNGELVAKPQAWLDGVFKGTIGDPQKFINLHNKEKIKYLLETQGKKLEYDELEKQREVKYAERTNLHRSLLAKKEELDKTDTSTFEHLEESDMDVAVLQLQLKEAESKNQAIFELQSRIDKGLSVKESCQKELENLRNQSESIDRQIEALKAKKLDLEKQEQEKSEYLDKVVDQIADLQDQFQASEKIDTTAILEQLNTHNATVAKNAQLKAQKELYEKQVEAKNQLQVQWKELDDAVLEIEQLQNDLIKDLNLSYKLKLED